MSSPRLSPDTGPLAFINCPTLLPFCGMFQPIVSRVVDEADDEGAPASDGLATRYVVNPVIKATTTPPSAVHLVWDRADLAAIFAASSCASTWARTSADGEWLCGPGAVMQQHTPNPYC